MIATHLILLMNQDGAFGDSAVVFTPGVLQFDNANRFISLPKNVAVVGLPALLLNRANGQPITAGSVTGYVTNDDAAQATIADTPGAKANGQWTVDLTAAERNATVSGVVLVHADGQASFTISVGPR